MAFGIYIHYPYCLQQCSYCDFATALHKNQELDSSYVKNLVKEIALRSEGIGPQKIDTIYFGGGTPSLMQSHHIVEVFNALEKYGFYKKQDCEISIEINPDTISTSHLQELQDLGVNRFSVGVQTFDDNILKFLGRKHSSADTRKTLELLATKHLNFSVDLLFALPGQTFHDLQNDVKELLRFSPSHFSPYLLTLPQKHFLQKNRPLEEQQLQMLTYIYDVLTTHGYEQYEISNFAHSKKYSQHNYNAWKGHSYWGLGMSAHSYLANGEYGVRFWNPPTVASYEAQLQTPSKQPYANLPKEQVEFLQKHEALTDFNHTRLRLREGLLWKEIEDIFGADILQLVQKRLRQEKLKDLVDFSQLGAKLSRRGIELSNIVFSEIVFLSEEIP